MGCDRAARRHPPRCDCRENPQTANSEPKKQHLRKWEYSRYNSELLHDGGTEGEIFLKKNCRFHSRNGNSS